MLSRIRYYVGLRSNGQTGIHDREVFKSHTEASTKTHSQYFTVIGPFRTKDAALMMSEPGAQFTDVSHAERVSKRKKRLDRKRLYK